MFPEKTQLCPCEIVFTVSKRTISNQNVDRLRTMPLYKWGYEALDVHHTLYDLCLSGPDPFTYLCKNSFICSQRRHFRKKWSKFDITAQDIRSTALVWLYSQIAKLSPVVDVVTTAFCFSFSDGACVGVMNYVHIISLKCALYAASAC